MVRVRATILLIALGLAPGCGARGVAPAPGVSAPAPAIVATSGAELPPGPGKRILDTRCTSCHGLNEVTKFRGFYARPQWRDVVVTMVQYGVRLTPEDVEVLADYLTEHLGRQ
jgi:hypothetical protein